MKKVFVLFEIDVFKTIKSRIFIGVFSTYELAKSYSITNKVESTISCADIVETEINTPNELTTIIN